MDPASDSVAFFGFAASPARVAGLLIESAKATNNLCSKFKRALDELKRFLTVLQQLELLLALLKDRSSHYADEDLPQGLKQF
jgi:uroporphyrinogen-III decarboxylase